MNQQQISIDVIREKYLKDGEQDELDLFARVATALASVEKPELQDQWRHKFYKNMSAGAIGAGRIMSAAGTEMTATLINCFVQPVGDACNGFDDDGLPGIFTALDQAAETMRRGGGVGYDFSPLRPRGGWVKTTNSQSSGPCPFMDVFDATCQTVESAGFRRGAQMGILRIDHPDVEEFVEAKRTPGRWRNFNVSVAVTDAFVEAVQNDELWHLRHKAEPFPGAHPEAFYDKGARTWVYKTVQARHLWSKIMKSAYDFAEPGIFFVDNVNEDNNLGYIERINCCNPCGEQPLPAYGCCDLGPIILTKFVKNPFQKNWEFDYAGFEQAVAIQVRALDNVLDLTYWPLQEQKAEAMAKRRIGVGFTGLGDALIMMCLRYDSEDGRTVASNIAKMMRNAAYRASIELAKEKGPFPLFEADGYLRKGTFASRLPQALQDDIRKHGIRNSHLLSIAPTGTVSLAFADNASNGIEPPFSWTYDRVKREGDGTKTKYTVEDHAYRLYRTTKGVAAGVDITAALPDYFVTALEMKAADHLAMMEVVQPFIDTAISKTVNVPADYPFEDFKGMYMQAWKAGLKGLATYRPNDILGAVLEVKKEEPKPAVAAPALEVDPMRAPIERRPAGSLDAVSEKVEYWTQDGKQAVYLIVSFMPTADGRERAIEFFMPVGQSNESQQWISTSMRLLCLAARGGFLERALEDMRKVKWDRGPVRLGTYTKPDGGQVPRWHDSETAAIAYAIENIIARRAVPEVRELATPPAPAETAPAPMPGKPCPECGAHAVIKKDGCSFCTACGHAGSCG